MDNNGQQWITMAENIRCATCFSDAVFSSTRSSLIISPRCAFIHVYDWQGHFLRLRSLSPPQRGRIISILPNMYHEEVLAFTVWWNLLNWLLGHVCTYLIFTHYASKVTLAWLKTKTCILVTTCQLIDTAGHKSAHNYNVWFKSKSFLRISKRRMKSLSETVKCETATAGAADEALHLTWFQFTNHRGGGTGTGTARRHIWLCRLCRWLSLDSTVQITVRVAFHSGSQWSCKTPTAQTVCKIWYVRLSECSNPTHLIIIRRVVEQYLQTACEVATISTFDFTLILIHSAKCTLVVCIGFKYIVNIEFLDQASALNSKVLWTVTFQHVSYYS